MRVSQSPIFEDSKYIAKATEKGPFATKIFRDNRPFSVTKESLSPKVWVTKTSITNQFDGKTITNCHRLCFVTKYGGKFSPNFSEKIIMEIL